MIASGASSATGITVAGSVVAGLGIVDWFRKLGAAKVNENLESLGQATEDALNRVERVLSEHGTSIDELKSRLNSQGFKDGMASASLQALRTAQSNRLKRLALILANGVREMGTVVSKLGEGIIRGLEQALAIAEGTAEKGSYVVHTPEEIEARQAAKRREDFAQSNEPRLE